MSNLHLWFNAPGQIDEFHIFDRFHEIHFFMEFRLKCIQMCHPRKIGARQIIRRYIGEMTHSQHLQMVEYSNENRSKQIS